MFPILFLLALHLPCIPPLRPMKSVSISWENIMSVLTRRLRIYQSIFQTVMGVNVKRVITISSTYTHTLMFTGFPTCEIFVDVLCGVVCTASPHMLYLAATVQVWKEAGLLETVLAYAGVQERKKFPWGCSLKNEKWKNEIKKKNRWKVPAGTVNEKMEWMG